MTSNDTGFITERSPDSVRGPDIAYWPRERLPEVPVGYIEAAPDLLVEVLSPSNTSKQIRAKLKEHFARGVRIVWVIAPEDRTLAAPPCPFPVGRRRLAGGPGPLLMLTRRVRTA